MSDEIDKIADEFSDLSQLIRRNGEWYSKAKPEVRKFAEMLIRECADVCRENSWITLTANQRAQQILDHFGVEE